MLCELIACSFLSLNNIPLYAGTTICFFILCIERNLGCFQLFTVMNKAAGNNCVPQSFRLLNQSSIDGVVYKQQKFLFHSLEAGSLRSGSQHGLVLVRALCFAADYRLLFYPQKKSEKESKLSHDAYKGANPSHEFSNHMNSFNPNHLPQPSPPNTITLQENRVSMYEF